MRWRRQSADAADYLYVRFRVTPNVMRYEMKVKSLPYITFLFGRRDAGLLIRKSKMTSSTRRNTIQPFTSPKLNFAWQIFYWSTASGPGLNAAAIESRLICVGLIAIGIGKTIKLSCKTFPSRTIGAIEKSFSFYLFRLQQINSIQKQRLAIGNRSAKCNRHQLVERLEAS